MGKSRRRKHIHKQTTQRKKNWKEWGLSLPLQRSLLIVMECDYGNLRFLPSSHQYAFLKKKQSPLTKPLP
jgi:hypothetical protein